MFELKWEFLKVIEKMLVREEERYIIQCYLMREELVGFLVESLVKERVSLTYLWDVYRVLVMVILDNPVGFAYLSHLLTKHPCDFE